MIDIGRKKDLEMLMSVINNEHESIERRRKAYRMFQSIKSKMGDKTILDLRLKLIAANMNNDADQVEKISMRIQDYENHKHLMRKY